MKLFYSDIFNDEYTKSDAIIFPVKLNCLQ